MVNHFVLRRVIVWYAVIGQPYRLTTTVLSADIKIARTKRHYPLLRLYDTTAHFKDKKSSTIEICRLFFRIVITIRLLILCFILKKRFT